jgi:hypothetical protein
MNAFSTGSRVKRMMLLLCVFAGLFLRAAVARADTQCPIKDFLTLRDVTETTTLIAFSVDLNGDGTNEVFLTQEQDLNGKMGNIWMVYISQGLQFHLSDQLPSINPESLFMLSSGKTQKQRLFYLTGEGRGEFRLFELAVNGFEISERLVTRLVGFRDEDADTISELLKGGNSAPVKIVRGKSSEFTDCVLGRK